MKGLLALLISSMVPSCTCRYCYLRDAYYLPGRAQRSDGAVDEPGKPFFADAGVD